MKTILQISIRILTLVFLLLLPAVAGGQSRPVIKYSNETFNYYYLNGGWQLNIPVDNTFADKASGWGMSFDAGYYFTPNWGIGTFLNFHTNHKYIPTQSIDYYGSVLTTNQQHSLFQFPVGLSMRYRILPGETVDPYLSIKLGANYAQMATYFTTYKIFDREWGFYLSPEIGANFWLKGNQSLGLNVALYFSYATNRLSVLGYQLTNVNNCGVRLGLAF
ncbi:MAG: outer membrane beta-barrel protein [Bacteroidales bacterium]